MRSKRLSTEELELKDLLDQVLLTVGAMVRAESDKRQEELARSQRGFETMFADLSKARAEIRKLKGKP